MFRDSNRSQDHSNSRYEVRQCTATTIIWYTELLSIAIYQSNHGYYPRFSGLRLFPHVLAILNLHLEPEFAPKSRLLANSEALSCPILDTQSKHSKPRCVRRVQTLNKFTNKESVFHLNHSEHSSSPAMRKWGVFAPMSEADFESGIADVDDRPHMLTRSTIHQDEFHTAGPVVECRPEGFSSD